MRGVAAGIGLARGSYPHHQEKHKNAEAAEGGSSNIVESSERQLQPQTQTTNEQAYGDKANDDYVSGRDEDDDL